MGIVPDFLASGIGIPWAATLESLPGLNPRHTVLDGLAGRLKTKKQTV